MKEPREVVGLAWLPVLITREGEVVEPGEEESWLAVYHDDRECRG